MRADCNDQESKVSVVLSRTQPQGLAVRRLQYTGR